jgi:hypothetical protein
MSSLHPSLTIRSVSQHWWAFQSMSIPGALKFSIKNDRRNLRFSTAWQGPKKISAAKNLLGNGNDGDETILIKSSSTSNARSPAQCARLDNTRTSRTAGAYLPGNDPIVLRCRVQKGARQGQPHFACSGWIHAWEPVILCSGVFSLNNKPEMYRLSVRNYAPISTS